MALMTSVFLPRNYIHQRNYTHLLQWTYDPTLLPWKYHLHGDGMCEDDSSMAIMLNHRSTALGRDLNSQVLKHREFRILRNEVNLVQSDRSIQVFLPELGIH